MSAKWPRGAAVVKDYWGYVHEIAEPFRSQVVKAPMVWARSVDDGDVFWFRETFNMSPLTPLARELLKLAERT